MKISVYIKPATLFELNDETGEMEPAGRSVKAVRDTTGKEGLPVNWDGDVIGYAVKMRKLTLSEIPLIEYEVEVIKECNTMHCAQMLNGFEGTISGAMWHTGLFPTEIHLVRCPL